MMTTTKLITGKPGKPTIDETGNTYGKLTVIRLAPREDHRARWECQCACGTTVTRLGFYLRSGKATNCGCVRKPYTMTGPRKARAPRSANAVMTSRVRSHLRAKWWSMVRRCTLDNDPAWENYGGRGIKVCPAWEHDFDAYYQWAIIKGYKLGDSVDREDNDGNYEPSNCRMADRKTQQRNRRGSVFTDEQLDEIEEAHQRTGIGIMTLRNRMKSNIPLDAPITVQHRNPTLQARGMKNRNAVVYLKQFCHTNEAIAGVLGMTSAYAGQLLTKAGVHTPSPRKRKAA
jgi:hypothetical protein